MVVCSKRIDRWGWVVKRASVIKSGYSVVSVVEVFCDGISGGNAVGEMGGVV